MSGALQVQEAMLTGESVPISKNLTAVAENAGLGDRKCMAFSATTVSAGQGLGVVVATGEPGHDERLVCCRRCLGLLCVAVATGYPCRSSQACFAWHIAASIVSCDSAAIHVPCSMFQVTMLRLARSTSWSQKLRMSRQT